MTAKLTGKVAVVTGSSGQGIGAAIARLLAAEGASLVTNGRSSVNASGEPTARDTADSIIRAGGRAEAVFGDVSDMDTTRTLIDAAIEHFGRIDIVVNNAAVSRVANIADVSQPDWDTAMAVNLRGAFGTAQFAVPHMRRQGGGRIINITSRGGLAGGPHMVAYAASKAGLMGFTFALAKELIDDGITVNCIAPTAQTPSELKNRVNRWALEGRPMASLDRTLDPNLSPEHTAPIVAYLSSDPAANITGQIFQPAGPDITMWSPPMPLKTITADGIWNLEKLEHEFLNTFGKDLRPPSSS